MFAHSADGDGAASWRPPSCGLPRWAKLSPNVPDVVEIAAGALEGGADGLTLVNTLLGPGPRHRVGPSACSAPAGGGLSGGAVHPVAVRAVWECRAAFPDVPIVGVGGVSTGRDAVELLLAGADAVQVGTATFRDPRAPWKVLRQLARWCDTHGTTCRRSEPACAAASAAEGAARRGRRRAAQRPGRRPVAPRRRTQMADSFGDRVAAAVAHDGAAVRRDRSVGARCWRRGG